MGKAGTWLRENRDVVSAAGAAVVLGVIRAPWWMWAVLGVVVVAIVVIRYRGRHVD